MKEAIKILVIDDEKEHRDTYRIILENRGFLVGEASSGDEALEILENEYYPLILCDYVMPGINGIEVLKKIKERYNKRIEVIIVTGYGGIKSAVEAMKLGAFGYFIKSHNPGELLLEINKAIKMIALQNKQNLISISEDNKRFLYQSKNPKMKDIINILENVASTDSNVLLLGESGVGKEVLAQKLHEMSNRSSMPFIPINCQYFPENLLESELFGHEKGAFTGANEKRLGRFEEANGGTIFLDEIGDISTNTQVKFLRVLENKTIERIGSNKQIKVDFRLICATNKNLEEEIKEHRFREDLFYRINTISIEIPPLRERKEDLEDMIHFFIDIYKKEFKKNIKRIDDDTLKRLLKYDYPGNIRELKNIIERMFVLSQDGVLRMDNNSLIRGPHSSAGTKTEIPDFNTARKEFEKEYLLSALKHHGNNITRTANAIGISRRQLFNKINQYNLKEIMG